MINYSGYLLNKYYITSTIKVLKSKFLNKKQKNPILKKLNSNY
jgi:hypothetical protein